MKIVKELNLNKTPQAAQLGSMIFAKNIKLTLDKQAITSEEGLLDALRNDTFMRQGNIKILGVISNGIDIIIFYKKTGAEGRDGIAVGHLQHTTDKDYTINLSDLSDPYDENPVTWHHEGGEVFGVATRNNKGELIIAVSERNATSDVPLKVINLSTGASANSTEISPEVPFGNLKFASDTNGGLIPSGLYYFFIRFEIDNGVWSKWQPLAHPKLAVSTQYKALIQHKYNYVGSRMYPLPSNPTAEEIEVINKKSIDVNALSVRIPYNDAIYDSDTCFNLVLRVYNGYVAKNAQIAYILQHENGSFGRLWLEFPLSVTQPNVVDTFNFQFDAKWTKEIAIDDLLENAFSIKNVENIAEFQGRLYISNFKESDYNVTNETVDCTITFGPSSSKYLDAGFGGSITKKSGNGDFITVYNTISNVEIPVVNDTAKIEKYYLNHYEEDVIYEKVHTGPVSILDDREVILTTGSNRYKTFFDIVYRSGLDKYGEGWINERDYLIATIREGVNGPDDYYLVRLDKVLYDSIVYDPTDLNPSYPAVNESGNGNSNINNYLIYNGSDAYTPYGINMGAGYHRFDIISFNNGVKGIAVVDANTMTVGGKIVSPKAVLDMSTIQHEALSGDDASDCLLVSNTIASSTAKDLKSIRSFLPFNTYRFFCHFVRKDGSYTNGILMRYSPEEGVYATEFTANPTGVNINNGGVGLAVRPITVSFSGITIPIGYVGYFISYQTYKDCFGYTGYVLRDVSQSFYGTNTGDAQVGQDKNSRSDPNPASTNGFGSNRFFNEHTPSSGTAGDAVTSNYEPTLALVKASDVEAHAVSFKPTKAYQLFTNTTIPNPHLTKDITNPILVSGDNTGDGKKVADSTGGNSGISCLLDTGIEAGSTIVTYYDGVTGCSTAPLERLTDIIYGSTSCDESTCDFNYPGFVTVHNFIEYLQSVYIDEEARVFKYSSTGAIENIIIGDELYAQANYVVGYGRYDLNAISVKKQPEVLVGLLNSVAGITGGIFTSGTTAAAIKSGEKQVNTIPETDKLLKVKQQNLIYKPINLIDLFEYKTDYIEKRYKEYIINNKNKVKNYSAVNIIRRSNVMANESDENGWNKFDANNYFVLTKNKGSITNLIVLHNQLIAHTEMSMFVFNGDNTIEQGQGNALQITGADIFTLNPVEIFADNYGYGGLQIRKLHTVNYSGYWFIDSYSKKLFVFNNGIADATYNFVNLLQDYEIMDGCIASDVINDRIILCLALEKDGIITQEVEEQTVQTNGQVISYATMSFDISTKKLISTHDYIFNTAVNLANRPFLASIDVKDNQTPGDNPYFAQLNKIFTFTPNTIFGDYNNLELNPDENTVVSIFKYIDSVPAGHKCSIVDIIFNINYEEPKILESIRWIVDRIDLYGKTPLDKAAEYVSDNQTNEIVDINKYAGYKIRIYTDSTDTKDITIGEVPTVNYVPPVINPSDQLTAYTKPRYERGVWVYNYFRNYLDVIKDLDVEQWYNVLTNEEVAKYIPYNGPNDTYKSWDELTAQEQAKLQRIKQTMSYSDNRSLIYGKYFVIRFIFDMGADNKPFKLENVDINISRA